MHLLLQTTSARAADLPGGYGLALVQTLLALAAVCVLAWVVLRWSAQRGLGLGQGQRIRVVERVALDARRTAYLVEVGGKLYFLAAGDGGPPALVATLDPSDVPEPDRPRTFLDVLRRPPAGAGRDAPGGRPPDGGSGGADARPGAADARPVGSAPDALGATLERDGASAAPRRGGAA